MVRLTLTGDFAMIRIVLFAFALLAAFAAQAQVYKCLDAKGVTVYRQDPCPPNMKRETMSKPAIAPAPAAAPAGAADKAAKGGPQTPAQQEQAFRSYVQDVAATAPNTADELSKLADLKAKGVITDAEFEQQKAKILS